MKVIRSLLNLSLLTSITSSSSSITSSSTSSAMKKITLLTFDVDGTLIHGSSQQAEYSAHARAFGHAVGKVYANRDDYEIECPTPLLKILPTNYHGCTDGLIALNLAKEAFGVEASDAFPKLQSVFRCMYEYFNQFDDQEAKKGIEILPGVHRTLSCLSSDKYKEHVYCGLVTGNVEGIARKKMRSIGLTSFLTRKADDQNFEGLNDYSFLGGFGSDYCSGDIDDKERIYKDRGEQIMIAYKRAKTLLNKNEKIVRVVHIGDAPADVLAAKYFADRVQTEVTVGCIGVATGKFDAKTLENLCGEAVPDVWEPVVLEKGIDDDLFITHCRIEHD